MEKINDSAPIDKRNDQIFKTVTKNTSIATDGRKCFSKNQRNAKTIGKVHEGKRKNTKINFFLKMPFQPLAIEAEWKRYKVRMERVEEEEKKQLTIEYIQFLEKSLKNSLNHNKY